MLARISEVTWRVVFTNKSSALRFALLQTRFEYAPHHGRAHPSERGLVQLGVVSG